MILRIRNWQKFQHYKNRRPPWVKLLFTLLNSRDWIKFSDQNRLLMVVCMLISSQSEYMDGRFEADPAYIQVVAHLDHIPDFKPLIDSQFLIEVAIKTQASASTAQAKAVPEKRREEERRDRGEKPAQPRRVPQPDYQKEIQDRAKIAARDKRYIDEREVQNQINAGSGPEIQIPPIGFMNALRDLAGKKAL